MHFCFFGIEFLAVDAVVVADVLFRGHCAAPVAALEGVGQKGGSYSSSCSLQFDKERRQSSYCLIRAPAFNQIGAPHD